MLFSYERLSRLFTVSFHLLSLLISDRVAGVLSFSVLSVQDPCAKGGPLSGDQFPGFISLQDYLQVGKMDYMSV